MRSAATTAARIGLPLLLFTILLVPGERVRLWDPDESYYAQAAREMIERGDWLSPVFNGENRFDKPALFYWMVIISYKTFGISEQAARVPSALFAALCLLLVSRWAGRGGSGDDANGHGAGAAAMLVLATSVEFFAMSRLALPDMPLAFFICLSVYCFYLHLEEGRSRWTLAAAWISAGFGVLAKGPVGVLLPVLAIAATLLFQRRPRDFLLILRPLPIALFVAVAAPWYVYMTLRHDDYFSAFFIGHNLLRYASGRHHHTYPFWYFLPVVAAGVSPWLLQVITECRGALRVKSRMYALVAAAAIVVFYSASGSKLPGYILPVFPLLAVIAAPAIQAATGWRAVLLPATMALQIVAALAALQTPAVLARFPSLGVIDVPAALTIAASVGALVALAVLLPRRAWPQAICGVIVIGFFAAAAVSFEEMKPAEKIVSDVCRDRGSERLASFRLQRRESFFLPSLVFYRDGEVADLKRPSELFDFFRQHERVFCVINDDDFRHMAWENWLPVYRIADYRELTYQVVLISNRPD